MVHLSILQETERAHGRKWIFTGKRLNIVVKVNNIGFPEA